MFCLETKIVVIRKPLLRNKLDLYHYRKANSRQAERIMFYLETKIVVIRKPLLRNKLDLYHH